MNFSRSALIYMKTIVCLKYFVNGCRFSPLSWQLARVFTMNLKFPLTNIVDKLLSTTIMHVNSDCGFQFLKDAHALHTFLNALRSKSTFLLQFLLYINFE